MASYTTTYIKCNGCGKIYQHESLLRYIVDPMNTNDDPVKWRWDGAQPQRRFAKTEGWVLKAPGGKPSRDYCPPCAKEQADATKEMR